MDNAGSTSGHQEIAERTADTPPRAPDSVVQPVPQPRDPVGTGLRVLLAEDDTMVARSTMALLRRLGHTPTHAVDGMSAWECLKVGLCDFDVLLLDMVMPRMTGSDLAYRARAAGFAGRIVLFSGLIMHVDPEALGLLGIGDFMTKPFLPSELERVLRAGDGVA